MSQTNMYFLRSRKKSMPAFNLNNMDYTRDFKEVMKSRSVSTSTPLVTKRRSLSICSPENDSGYPDSIIETSLSACTKSIDSSTKISPSDCDVQSDGVRQTCSDKVVKYSCSPLLEFSEWDAAEEEDVFEKRPCKRLSDIPRYSLEFDSCDLDSSFGASSLAEDLHSVQLDNVIQHFSPREPDRLIGRKIGIDKVDVLSELDVRNLQGVSLILSYLEPLDLTRARAVSQRWRKICDGDTKSRRRRREYKKSLKCQAFSVGKENVKLSKRNPLLEQRGLTSGDVLMQVQQVQTPPSPKKTCPSNSFSQAVATLQKDDTLRHCPKCNFAAKTLAVLDRAVCMNTNCNFDFCTKCFCEQHGARNCVPVATKKSKTDSVGTKKSKKNLRRL